MSFDSSFKNNFKKYSLESSLDVLTESKDEIADRFITKLKNFEINKKKVLHSSLESSIFHDYSVYTGSAGIALYYLMCMLNKQGLENECLDKALSYLNLNSLKAKRISFLCGDAGPLSIATVISYRLGNKRPIDLPDYKTLCERLISLISLLDESPDELLYGKSGYLFALLFVKKYIRTKDLIPANHIQKVTYSIIKSGKEFASRNKYDCPLLYQWHDKIYLGAAHGLAGILYMLLQARDYINSTEIRSLIRPTIDWLLDQQFPSGNFPSSINSNSGDRLVQWCHGAPGLVPLCLLSHIVFNEDKYLKVALRCGEVVWERGLCTKGYSICHGVSGNAYTFLQLFQATKNPLHLYRACCFAEWCCVERASTELRHPDRPASLYEGLTGRLYLAQDMSTIHTAAFPGFEI